MKFQAIQMNKYVVMMLTVPLAIPRLQLYFLTNDTFQIQFRISDAFMIKLKEGVKWPIEISVQRTGFLLRMYKLTDMNWTEPLFKYLDTDKHPIKATNVWKSEVVSNEKLTRNAHLIGFKYKQNAFNLVGVGDHICILKRIKGSLEENNYNLVPYLPSVLSFRPMYQKGAWQLSDTAHYIIIKSDNKPGIGRWLSKRKVGDELITTAPDGHFTTDKIRKMKNIYLFAAGTGITPLLSVIIWLLQNRMNFFLKLFYFNHCEEDIIWKDKLDTLVKKYRRVFKVKYYVSHVRNSTLKIKKGRMNDKLLIKHVPPYSINNATMNDGNFFGVCGPNFFGMGVMYNISSILRYPARQIYNFVGQ